MPVHVAPGGEGILMISEEELRRMDFALWSWSPRARARAVVLPRMSAPAKPNIVLVCQGCSGHLVTNAETSEQAERARKLSRWSRVLLCEEWKVYCPVCW